ncbi:dienelactone hydrolase family protein [Nostoc sp.]|uniref:dienelactone hydrolase family protein n=1 Tax=Nostoc sp. TaxID=1180 RepID=UPI002FFBA472
MTNTEIRTAEVKVPNGDLQIDAYLAEPAKEGTFPAVIVIQEIFGVNIHIREVAEIICQTGICCDVYDGLRLRSDFISTHRPRLRGWIHP